MLVHLAYQLWPFVVWILGVILMAAVGGRARGLHGAGLLVACSALVLPWLLPEGWTVARAALALLTIWEVARYLELTSPVFDQGMVVRLWHLVAFVDTRQAKRTTPALRWRRLLAALAWGCVTLAGLALAAVASEYWPGSSPPDPWSLGPLRLVGRWVGGTLFIYALLETYSAAIEVIHQRFGWQIAEVHANPIVSTSVAEFWGRRWNRPVTAWLREHWARPCRRSGHPSLAVFGSFLASALGHAAYTWPATNLPMAAVVFVFFVVQALGMLGERALGTPRRPWMARTRTVLFMVISSPLFMEPTVRILLPPVGAGP